MINIINRKIDKIETISVMNDKEVIKLSFECVNQVTDLLKLTDCDHIYINYMNGSTKDRYLITDLTLDGDNVNFTWLLGRNATKNIGKTYFVICAERTDDGTILQEWNSIVASFDVEKGLETLTAETEPYEDIFSQVFDSLDTKLEPTNIKAGDNVTVTRNGNDVTISSQGGGGTGDYADLENKPKINSVELSGNKSLSDLGIQPNDFVVTFTEQSGTYSADKTITDIYNAYSSGKRVYGKEGGLVYTLISCVTNSASFELTSNDVNIMIVVNASSVIKTQVSIATSNELSAEALARQNADNNLQGQIDAITVSSDVVDVVGTYTDLVNYDTQHIKANDIVKVLQDSTHNDALSYYRWVITENVGAWTYVGSEGPFYTKGEADILLQGKLGTDAVKQSTGSSTTDVMSQDAVTSELSGKVSTSAIVQATGQSTTDIMSQKAVTDELSGKLSNPLIFTNVSASSWVDNATTPDTYFENYAYKCVLSCQGVTSSMLATVIFADAQAQSEDYSNKCSTGTDTVTIYSNDNSAISIPTIVAGVPIEVEVNEKHNYSTDEKIIGTWVDGKTLYEKSFVLNASQLVSGTSVNTDLLSSEIDTMMFDLSASYIQTKDNNDGTILIKTLSYYDPLNNQGFRLQKGTTYVEITMFKWSDSNNVVYGDSVITLHYTKSS